eukprot:715503-Amphidinium_carterae.2
MDWSWDGGSTILGPYPESSRCKGISPRTDLPCKSNAKSILPILVFTIHFLIFGVRAPHNFAFLHVVKCCLVTDGLASGYLPL